MATLADDLPAWLARSRAAASARSPLEPRLEQIGRVAQVGDGVATVRGPARHPARRTARLRGRRARSRRRSRRGHDRLRAARRRDRGLPREAWCAAPARSRACRSATALLGRVVDALGAPLDGGEPIAAERYAPVEAAGAGDRRPRAGDAAARDRAPRRRRDDPARPRPARADHRRPRHRQDRDRRRHHHQPAFERRDLRLCRDRPEGVLGRAGHRRGRAATARRSAASSSSARPTRRRACNG